MVIFLLIVIATLLAILVLANDSARALLAVVGLCLVGLVALVAIGIGLILLASYAFSSPEALADTAFGAGALVLIASIASLVVSTEQRLRRTSAGQRVIGGINAVLGGMLILILLSVAAWLVVTAVAAALSDVSLDASTLALIGAGVPAVLIWISYAIARHVKLIRTGPRI